jgi:hypothetical protein
MITAEVLTMCGGLVAFLLTVSWVRTRELREKYAVAWLGVATILLVVGLSPDLLKAVAATAHLSYPAAVLFIALALIYPYAFFVTVSLSRHYRRSSRLVQEIALLECRVRELERRVPSPEREGAA